MNAAPRRAAAPIQPFLAMEILERAEELERKGIDIVHLEVGEPDFNVPACVERAAAAAVRSGATHYTHSLGIRALREEISLHYGRLHRIEVSPERVIVTTGTSGGLTLIMALLLDPGDEVLIPDPGYACYPNFVRAFHGEPCRFPVAAKGGYRYEARAIREAATPRTRAVIINSPANPTSAVQDLRTLEEIASLGLTVVSDEVYQGLEHGPPAASMLQATRDCFVLDGFSKRYAMTGWRIGWLVVPEDFVTPLQKLQQNLFICAGSVAQHAGLAALREAAGDVESMRREYGRRRAAILDGVRKLGLPVALEPEGAFYLLVDARAIDPDSLRLARRILEEAHVGVCPGIDFGPAAEGHIRLSFASPLDRIEEGLRRLGRWIADRRDR